MPEIFEQLHLDHINYSRLLNLLELQIDRHETDNNPDYLLMQDIMKYMINYPDIFHHPAEEFLFSELGEVEEKDAAMIEKLCEEHSTLAELAGELKEQLQNASTGHIVERRKILDVGRRYVDTYREHINLEETEIFPLLKSAINHETMDRVRQQMGKIPDPLFSDAVSDEYNRLFRSITEQDDDGTIRRDPGNADINPVISRKWIDA